MIIKRLTMHNFGVYASTNTFEFHGTRPIVLIGGLNGRGKTTFLDAILISLYGAKSFAYKESKFKSFGQYLRSFINKTDGTLKTFVELEFQINDDVYVVRKEWDALNKLRTYEKIFVSKNGENSSFLSQNWLMFIENILPSALSNFYFFDGEKIAELAVESTDSQLKESIRAMLGLSAVDALKADISKNIKSLKKMTVSNDAIQNLETLRQNREECKIKFEEAQSELDSHNKELNQFQKDYEDEQNKFAAVGGNLFGKREDLLKQRTVLTAKLEQVSESMINVAAGALPLALVKDLLKKVYEQGSLEKREKVQKNVIQSLNRLYSQYVNNTGLNSGFDAVKDFIGFVNKVTVPGKVEDIYSLSDLGLLQAEQLSSGIINSSELQAADLIKLKIKLAQEINEIDSLLAIDINEQTVKKTYGKIQLLQRQIIDCKSAIDLAKKRLSSTNGEYLKSQTKFNQSVSKYLESLETNDDLSRSLKYYEMTLQVLNDYQLKLQKEKSLALGEVISNCYKQLANKKNLIEKIVVDPYTLNFEYYNKDKQIVEKSALSAGEKQLMVISILWALAICSKKTLPVIIDTPLSRLDSNHRRTLVQIYFPNASNQTIILSTDSEIDRKLYGLMQGNIGDEFTLQYNDSVRSTTIQRGYFQGDLNDR